MPTKPAPTAVPTAAENKGVVKAKTFKSEGDWINRILTKHTADTDSAGKVTGAVSLPKLKRLAKENGITHRDSYPNSGMWRMNIGNMLRAKARREGKLMVEGKAVHAPADFLRNEKDAKSAGKANTGNAKKAA